MSTINQPISNPDRDAAQDNWNTHSFGYGDRCAACDCRPYGRVAQWPCGADVERETVEDNGGPDYLTVAAGRYNEAVRGL